VAHHVIRQPRFELCRKAARLLHGAALEGSGSPLLDIRRRRRVRRLLPLALLYKSNQFEVLMPSGSRLLHTLKMIMVVVRHTMDPWLWLLLCPRHAPQDATFPNWKGNGDTGRHPCLQPLQGALRLGPHGVALEDGGGGSQ